MSMLYQQMGKVINPVTSNHSQADEFERNVLELVFTDCAKIIELVNDAKTIAFSHDYIPVVSGEHLSYYSDGMTIPTMTSLSAERGAHPKIVKFQTTGGGKTQEYFSIVEPAITLLGFETAKQVMTAYKTGIMPEKTRKYTDWGVYAGRTKIFDPTPYEGSKFTMCIANKDRADVSKLVDVKSNFDATRRHFLSDELKIFNVRSREEAVRIYRDAIEKTDAYDVKMVTIPVDPTVIYAKAIEEAKGVFAEFNAKANDQVRGNIMARINATAKNTRLTPCEWQVEFGGKIYIATSKRGLADQLFDDFNKAKIGGGETWSSEATTAWLKAYEGGDRIKGKFTRGTYKFEVPDDGNCFTYVLGLLLKEDESEEPLSMAQQREFLSGVMKKSVSKFNEIKSGNSPIILHVCETLGIPIVFDDTESQRGFRVFVSLDMVNLTGHCTLYLTSNSPRFTYGAIVRAIEETPLETMPFAQFVRQSKGIHGKVNRSKRVRAAREKMISRAVEHACKEVRARPSPKTTVLSVDELRELPVSSEDGVAEGKWALALFMRGIGVEVDFKSLPSKLTSQVTYLIQASFSKKNHGELFDEGEVVEVQTFDLKERFFIGGKGHCDKCQRNHSTKPRCTKCDSACHETSYCIQCRKCQKYGHKAAACSETVVYHCTKCGTSGSHDTKFCKKAVVASTEGVTVVVSSKPVVEAAPVQQSKMADWSKLEVEEDDESRHNDSDEEALSAGSVQESE